MAKNVFLSHNSDDKPAVEKLAEKLAEAGFEPWLDKWNLVPGDPWQPALEAALKECDVCAVFLGPGSVGPWQNEEMQIAINRRVADKQFRVIPVLLPNTPRGRRGDVPSFLAIVTWIEFRQSLDDPEAFERLVNAINGLPTRPRKSRIQVGSCPYKGLETFDVGDAANFFGRDALTDWLVADVRRMLESDREPRFLAIVGASGSGKSSVARAGLLYELQQGAIAGSDRWARIIIGHPGRDPVEKLATEGAEVLGLSRQAIALERDFIHPIRQEPKHANKLHLQAELALAKRPGQRLLLFIDQFEEIFTACNDEDVRLRFVDLLLHAARAFNGKVIIVITLRQDFLPRCAAVPGLYDMISGGIELIGDMSDDELREAIVRPAALAEVDFSPSLATTLIKAVRKQPGSLPLLEYVLKKLWEQKTGATISDNDYTDGVKGLEQALADHADAILTTRCGTGEQQQRVLSLLTRLVHISDADKPETDTRVRYAVSDSEYELLIPFVDERLLIASSQYDPNNSQSTGRLIEVAHEALIRHWPKLQAAIKDRKFQNWREGLDQQIKDWQNRRDPGILLEGQRLKDARQWQRLYPSGFNQEERNFIRTCQRRVYLRIAQIASAVSILPLLILWFFLWSEAHFSTPKVGFYVLLAKMGIYTVHPRMMPIPPEKDCTVDVCEFLMGSPENAEANEKPQHKVRFNYRFAMSKTEVTFEQYEVFSYLITEGGCQNKKINGKTHQVWELDDQGYGRGIHPVIKVSWYDAVCYAQWLSQQTGKRYRLPTEAEWEYATRAGTSSKYYWDDKDPKNYAWYSENTDKTQPVGQKQPNDFNLYDMSGNVEEWVQDCWHWDYNNAPLNSSAWFETNGGDCSLRVLRGGSWRHVPGSLRSAFRFGGVADNRDDTIGFRLAQDLP